MQTSFLQTLLCLCLKQFEGKSTQLPFKLPDIFFRYCTVPTILWCLDKNASSSSCTFKSNHEQNSQLFSVNVLFSPLNPKRDSFFFSHAKLLLSASREQRKFLHLSRLLLMQSTPSTAFKNSCIALETWVWYDVCFPIDTSTFLFRNSGLEKPQKRTKKDRPRNILKKVSFTLKEKRIGWRDLQLYPAFTQRFLYHFWLTLKTRLFLHCLSWMSLQLKHRI
jgi:hypothetical protein